MQRNYIQLLMENNTVQKVAKPQVPSGECKTDIYIEALNRRLKRENLKLSYKQEKNAEFIENKMKARARSILGSSGKVLLNRELKNQK